tara:strand:- start:18 stop:218 length:201 start_codon:yes stop_codon:yes gene_type:complete
MISNKHFFIEKSQWLRKEIFEMVIRVNQEHIASALSQCETLISIFYGDILNYKKTILNMRIETDLL